jgi:plastocyanin
MRRTHPAAVLLLVLAAAALAAPAGAATHDVDSRDFVFVPADLTIAPGDTVRWTNVEGSHNVLANNGSFTSGPVASGNWVFSHTFNSEGDFRYFCQLHGGAAGFGMAGIVRVVAAGGGDDAPGNLRFAAANVNVAEGNTATLTVQRVGGDDGAVSVSFATADGTAVAGGDYAPTSGTLSWADNDDNPKTFQVTTIEDSGVESSETVNVVLSNPTGGAGLGAPSAATVTINDDDATGTPGNLSFAAATLSVDESSGAAQLVVRRTGGTTGAVSVRVTTHDGTATGGADFTHVDQVVTFASGDAANKTVTVPIVDDFDVEATEALHAMLTAPTGGAALANPTMADVQILDDDAESGPCIEDAETLCLTGGRFRVTVDFRPPGEAVPRPAQRIELTDDSGLFWFFQETNVEMLIKTLDACVDPFNRFWVFFAATTNVEFTVTVTDTERNQTRRYSNQQGQAALPVQDTNAFATCP